MGPETPIPLTPVQRVAATRHYDAPYRVFIAASLTLGLGGGFMLAILLPADRAGGWNWLSGVRWQALVQAHGQLQLLGFAGLFIMGMSLRLIPRFSSRYLAYATLIRALVPLVASSLILRAIAQPAAHGTLRNVALIMSALLLLAAAAAFAAIIGRALIHRDSRAESTGYFFVLGSLAYLVAALVNCVQMLDVVRHDLDLAPLDRQAPLLILQQYGFVLMFVGGIATRAIPTLSGHNRPDRFARACAVVLAVGAAIAAIALLWAASRHPSRMVVRLENVGLLLVASALCGVAIASGALYIGRSRVAAASQPQFWLVRSAMFWLLTGGLMLAWYVSRALVHDDAVDAFELDATRHVFMIGVVAILIVGMATLIVPEFAGRRLQHPPETRLVMSLVVTFDFATALRVWPALEGVSWLAETRYWPMTVAAVAASAAILAFAATFAQSYLEQRAPHWASPEALASRNAPRPGKNT